ncbi:helix-turn-helix domain-containing protein [Streptococcus alactolyticus]|uniref:helix-turn-helix domain-containing protein n=1 Tax=Streptococcus alactolyticus TaxID=29389 RepID=UPI001F328DAA|nr:helix-turn-helix transcriptional regulator [Streptococcus alactolyticus]MCF2666910.1 helix-turn-helix transcriptional regulator [Streptococcus alactolyticus]MCF2679030.1 helix-turn-helix transcriptional regulator [Streptococcus alactolyticus]GLB79199.1 transcriptional regulator [Streptococcus alactolyticus]
MYTTFDRVKELSQKRGISLSKLEETLGLGKNSIYALKRNQPSAERLQEIADYFNVSTDYLLGRTDNPKIASDEVAGYTTEDLRKMARNAKTFDGKPLTDEDVEAITNIIEIYLKGRS